MRLRQHYFLKFLENGWRGLPDNLILTVLTSRIRILFILCLHIVFLRRIRNQILRQLYALTSYPPQLFGLALVILAKIVYLLDEGLKLFSLWLFAGVIRENEYLVLEGLIKRILQHEYLDVSKVQRGLFLNRSSLASIILYKTLSFTSFSCFLYRSLIILLIFLMDFLSLAKKWFFTLLSVLPKPFWYLPPSFAAMMAHLLPSSSWRWKSNLSSASVQFSFIISGFRWLLYLNVGVVTSIDIACRSSGLVDTPLPSCGQ